MQDLLNKGRGHALFEKLESAHHQLERGNINAAEAQLRAFIHLVSGLIASDALTVQEGGVLIDTANRILAQLAGLDKPK